MPIDKSDTWADTKCPGDGRYYSVGTTTISRDSFGVHSRFHNKDASLPGTFQLPLNSSKQVVILQVADPTLPDGIAHQSYFFGADPAGQGFQVQQGTFARAISVWPAVTATGTPDYPNTRIAICGETFDPTLPMSWSAPRPGWQSGAGPSGFIAVFDGEANLLWSNQYYGQAPTASTAVTDVSIRVDPVTANEIVTYCGMSTNGVYAPQPSVASTMGIVRPFDSPGTPPVGCGIAYGSGSYHNGILPTNLAYDWDGFVGRVATQGGTIFHCIVGGSGDDALFGISEFDTQIFSVCGTTRWPATNRWGSTVVFPLTVNTYKQQAFCFTASGGEAGVVLTFMDTGDPQKIQLLSSYPIGSPGEYTGASDLLWHGRAPNGPQLYIVGTTSDPAFNLIPGAPLIATSIQQNLIGPSDGYVAIGSLFDLTYASLLSDISDSIDTVTSDYLRRGATGISAWNEFHDHIAVVGWMEELPQAIGWQGNSRITVDNLFRADDGLKRVRRWIVDGASVGPRADSPGTEVGGRFQNAQFSTVPQFVGSVGSMAGGGCAVDPRGLVAVVGSMLFPQPLGGTSFPVVGPAMQVLGNEGSVLANRDAVRLLADMLPNNVCRTDGIDCPSLGWVRNSGDGGTTPACARALNGTILTANPGLERMLIDFEGEPASGQPAAIVVDRPPAGVSSLGFLQLGLPASDPVITVAPGVELWMSGLSLVPLNSFQGGGSFREPLWGPAGLPVGSFQFSVQFISLMVNSLCGNSTFTYAASPALLVGY